MIELKSVFKQYTDVPVLQDIHLSIPQGQIFGIIGRSGAGKSSLLRMINLLEYPSKGEVWFNNLRLDQMSEHSLRAVRHQIGMIFQHFNLQFQKTVFENIALPLRISKMPGVRLKQRVAELLQITQLTDKQHHYPSQLSGGQKQRVAIARALANQPKVLLCDEATSALDPETTKTILQLLLKINQQFGITIVLITHEMEVVKSICDRVALIEKGKIVRDETVIDFFLKPDDNPELEFLNTYLKHDIPEPIQARLSPDKQINARPLVRIIFKGDIANQPVIADLMKSQQVDVSILQGNIEYIKGEPVGHVIATISKEHALVTDEELQQITQILNAKSIYVEELGYVT